MYYVENGSKNRSGSFKDKPDDNKVIKHYGNSTLGDTVNREIFVLKIFHVTIFRVKIFSYTSRPYENILTTKILRTKY